MRWWCLGVKWFILWRAGKKTDWRTAHCSQQSSSPHKDSDSDDGDDGDDEKAKTSKTKAKGKNKKVGSRGQMSANQLALCESLWCCSGPQRVVAGWTAIILLNVCPFCWWLMPDSNCWGCRPSKILQASTPR